MFMTHTKEQLREKLHKESSFSSLPGFIIQAVLTADYGKDGLIFSFSVFSIYFSFSACSWCME